MNKPQTKVLVLAKPSNTYIIVPYDDNAPAAVEAFLSGSPAGGVIYRIDYYKHHANTAQEEVLPRSTKVGEYGGR